MKKLFKIKETIIALSKNRINTKLLSGIFIVTILTIVLPMLGFKSDFLKAINEIIKPLQNIPGSEKSLIYSDIIIDLIGLLLIYLVLAVIIVIITSWIVKMALSIFKKDITFYKIVNIHMYSLLVNYSLMLILIFLIILTYPVLLLILKNSTESQIETIFFLLSNIISLFSIGLYIYGIKISFSDKKLIEKKRNK